MARPPLTLDDLRRYAVARSLFRPTTLRQAFVRMGFVQADPIRAPARAQDLILRQRVRGYRAGDLDRHYPALDLDEDRLHVYGFVARRLRPYLYPRHHDDAADGRFVATGRTADVLAYVRAHG